MRFPTIAIFLILPVLLISSQSALGHTLNDQICEDINLQLDRMNNVCVADLSIVCVISLHGDSFSGGFTNVGIDQFGNSCKEVHPDEFGLFPRSPTSPIIDLFGVMIIALTLIIVSILVFIVARRAIRR